MANNGLNAFEIPQDWQQSTLGESCELLMGNSPPGSTYNEHGDGVPLINGPAEYGPQHPSPVKWTTAASRICRPKDVLICVRGNTTGRLNIADREYCIGRGVAAVRGIPSIALTDFIYYRLVLAAPRILETATGGGSTFPNINKPQLNELSVPLPPLEEQRAIAGVLRTVQRAKEATENVIAAARQLKQSLMRHLFTYGPVPFQEADQVELQECEVGAIPTEWKVVTLEDVSDFLQYGTSKRCELKPVGNPVLRIPNVVHDVIDTTELKYAKFDDTELNKMTLADGDILFVRTNGRKEYIGRCAVYRGEPPASLFASYLIRARLLKERLDPDFFQFYATTQEGRRFLSGRATSASDGKFNINTQILKQVQLPEPSMEVQIEIVDAIQRVESKERRERERANALSAIFESLLHELMTGQRRVHDLGLEFTEGKAA